MFDNDRYPLGILGWQALDGRIEALNAEFVAVARHDHAARRLVTIPGVGVLNATALVGQ